MHPTHKGYLEKGQLYSPLGKFSHLLDIFSEKLREIFMKTRKTFPQIFILISTFISLALFIVVEK